MTHQIPDSYDFRVNVFINIYSIYKSLSTAPPLLRVSFTANSVTFLVCFYSLCTTFHAGKT